MVSIFRWIMVIGITFYISLLYTSVPLALLGYAQILILIISCLFLIYRVHTLRCCLKIPIFMAECGMPLTIQFLVENSSFLSCPRLKYCLEQRSYLLKKKHKKWICGGAVLPGENSYNYTLVFQNYGSYGLQLKKVRIYDLTGLFYLNKTVKNESGAVQVFPNMQEVGVHLTQAVQNFFGDADIYDDLRPGYDNSELFQIRPFQKGDKIQRIHWKLSAKMDDLLVKEDSLPKACPVVFYLDYHTKKQTQEKKADAYLVILASISYSLMDAGCPHYVAWYSMAYKDVVRVRVDHEEGLYLFLSCYLEETFWESSGQLTEAYQEKYRGELYLHSLMLNEALELKKNGEKIAVFTIKGLEKELQQLELLL